MNQRDGREASDEKVARIKARQTAYRLLKYRPRSEQEIIDKLRKKDFPKTVIAHTVDELRKTGLVDDRQFALGWTRSRLNKPFGVKRISYELKQKGIDGDIADDAIRQATEHHDEFEVLLELAKRRLSKYKHLDRQKAKQRLFGYLSRRGFSGNIVFKVLKEVEAS